MRQKDKMSKETIDTLILSMQEEIQQSVMRIVQEKLLSHYRSELEYCQKKVDFYKQKEENIELTIVEKEEIRKDLLPVDILHRIIKTEEEEEMVEVPVSTGGRRRKGRTTKRRRGGQVLVVAGGRHKKSKKARRSRRRRGGSPIIPM